MKDCNDIKIIDGMLIIIPNGWNKLWTLRRQISIPLNLISAVTVNYNPHHIKVGARIAGLDFMGKLAGYFSINDTPQFWNYSGQGEILTIAVKPGAEFQELYLSVKNTEHVANLIKATIQHFLDS